ncbi:MAG: CinA family protein [Rhodanobacteraceae bacterium]|nr:MAG: CinA family protein [Rhodanobacteraceae bacterium]
MDRIEVPTDGSLRACVVNLSELLRARGEMLATAESCTGGWIAKACTDVAGSSAWFDGGAVTYSNAAKRAVLGVAQRTLDRYGAVSRATALEMAAGVLERFGASVAVAVTGIAGPAGGTPDKPVGTVWIAWQRRGIDARTEVFHFDGDRDAVRRHTVAAALAGVRKSLTT